MTGPVQAEEGELLYRVKRSGERYNLGLPTEIGKKLEGKTFALHFTDDGILYRPVKELIEGMPEWLSTLVAEE